MKSDPNDEHACKSIIASLESRWSKADQEPFIACIILNPLYRLQPFASLQHFNVANIVGLMRRLFKRFFDNFPSLDFSQEVVDYIGQKGNYSNLSLTIELEVGLAARKVSRIMILCNHKFIVFRTVSQILSRY